MWRSGCRVRYQRSCLPAVTLPAQHKPIHPSPLATLHASPLTVPYFRCNLAQGNKIILVFRSRNSEKGREQIIVNKSDLRGVFFFLARCVQCVPSCRSLENLSMLWQSPQSKHLSKQMLLVLAINK